jgi:hypothetical protein
MIIGGILQTLGCVASAFAPSIEWVVVSFGVIAGRWVTPLPWLFSVKDLTNVDYIYGAIRITHSSTWISEVV